MAACHCGTGAHCRAQPSPPPPFACSPRRWSCGTKRTSGAPAAAPPRRSLTHRSAPPVPPEPCWKVGGIAGLCSAASWLKCTLAWDAACLGAALRAACSCPTKQPPTIALGPPAHATPPAPPPIPATGDAQPLIDASDAAWAPAPASSGLGGGMRRNASMFFPQASATAGCDAATCSLRGLPNVDACQRQICLCAPATPAMG